MDMIEHSTAEPLPKERRLVARDHARPRASLDAPRVQLWGARKAVMLEIFDAFNVFREGAENNAQGGRGPHSMAFVSNPLKQDACVQLMPKERFTFYQSDLWLRHR